MAEICGFDLVPPITNGIQQDDWKDMLAKLKQHYVAWPDEKVKPKGDHIFFAIGEGLKLPKDGTKFRSFASICNEENLADGLSVIGTVATHVDSRFGPYRVKIFQSGMSTVGIDGKECNTESV